MLEMKKCVADGLGVSPLQNVFWRLKWNCKSNRDKGQEYKCLKMIKKELQSAGGKKYSEGIYLKNYFTKIKRLNTRHTFYLFFF